MGNVASKRSDTIVDNINDSMETTKKRPLLSRGSVSTVSSWLTTGLNVATVLAVIIACIILRSDMVKVAKRGFFCDDLSIRYPIKAETVSTKLLIAVTFIVGTILFSVAEYCCSSRKKQRLVRLFGRSISVPNWIGPMSCILFTFLMGSAATSIVTSVAKFVIGWPRPNFMAVCKPNVVCDSNDRTYYTNYTCTGATQDEEQDARQSFPSGHASFVAYAATFVVLYVHVRLKNCSAKFARPTIQLAIGTTAWWSAMTRVTDYVHHPVDVVAGLALGIFIGLWVFKHVHEWMQEYDAEENRNETDMEDTDNNPDGSPSGNALANINGTDSGGDP